MNRDTELQSQASAYIQRLDLGADPFSQELQSDYFYDGAMRRQVLEQLVHFSCFSDKVVLLVGSTGDGTSRVLDEAFEQLQQVMDCCDIDGEQDSSPEQILASLAVQLQLGLNEYEGASEFLSALNTEDFFADEDSQPLLIAVDQAHFLSIESFQLLSALLELSKGAIKLLFVGEHQVDQLLKLSGFQFEQLKTLELVRLSQEETAEYLLGLLRSVGYAGDQPLSADQLAILQEQSGGNIAEIQNLAAALLAVDSSAQSKGFSLQIPLIHAAAIAVLLVTLAFSYWFMGEDDPQTPVLASTASAIAEPGVQRSGKSVIDRGESEAADNIDVDISHRAEIDPPPDRDQMPPDREDDGAENLSLPIVAMPVQASTGTAEDLKPLEAEPAEEQEPVAALTLLANDDGISKDEAPPEIIDIDASPESNDIEAATESIDVENNNDKATVSGQHRYLLDIPATDYMLQLIGTVNEDRVVEFVKRHDKSLPLIYFETRRNNKPWYVALAGPYSSHAAAKVAVKGLPAQLAKLQPWIRSVLSLHNDIHKYK